MNKVITSHEQDEFNKTCNNLSLDAETKKTALTYFIEYKMKTKQVNQINLSHSLTIMYQASVERPALIISCAILAAAKSQVLTTVNGDTIRGVGISISQLLRGLDMSNKYDKFRNDILKL